MEDRTSGSGGRGATDAEAARRFYKDQHGGKTHPADTVTRSSTSHYGAQPSGMPDDGRAPQIASGRDDGAAPIADDNDRRQPRRGQADEADRTRSLALGERADQGSDGPHILDRSFGGTYDDKDRT